MNNRFLIFFLCFLALASCSVFASDTEVLNDDGSYSYGVGDESLLNANIPDSYENVEYNNSVEVLSVSASSTSGLHSVVLSLIGDYNPIVKDVTYSQGSYTSHHIEVVPDWSWIASAAIFIIVLFCVFRLVGGLISHV